MQPVYQRGGVLPRVLPWAEGRSRSLMGCSNCPEGVPEEIGRRYYLLPTNNTRAAGACGRSRGSAACPAGVPVALRAFQKPAAVPIARRPFQMRFARSRGFRTEILSPTNEQYKGRRLLRPFQRRFARSIG